MRWSNHLRNAASKLDFIHLLFEKITADSVSYKTFDQERNWYADCACRIADDHCKLCPAVLESGFRARQSSACRSPSCSRQTHRYGLLAGLRQKPGEELSDLSSPAQSGSVVGFGWQSHFAPTLAGYLFAKRNS